MLQQRRATNETRHGLDETGLGIALHRLRQENERLARHDAVAIENDEMWIRRAETAHPLSYISSFARIVFFAPAIVDRQNGADLRLQCLIDAGFPRTINCATRVGQHEHVEQGLTSKTVKLVGHGLDSAGNPGWVFMKDGEQQGCPPGQG